MEIEESKEIESSIVVALDNDQCIVCAQPMMFAYQQARKNCMPLCVRTFADMLDKFQCARPGLRELFSLLVGSREKGAVRYVVMCTAASNESGWVHFLAKVLEEWFGKPIYDYIVHGDDMTEWHRSHGSNVYMDPTKWMVKDMNCVRAACSLRRDAQVLIVDDRPAAVRHATSIIGVSAYYSPCDLGALIASAGIRGDFSRSACEYSQWYDFVVSRPDAIASCAEPIDIAVIIEALLVCILAEREKAGVVVVDCVAG